MGSKKKKLISENNEWNFELLEYADKEISRVAKDYLKLDTYPNQLEIVSSEQMLDAYSLVGLPISYPHWKFGKAFVSQRQNYIRGRSGLAYELVINSNPCISYNMEDNTAVMQCLVLAHAAYGHNSFFKNNYMFKDWTDAENIIDYMVYARNFVLSCEEKFGYDKVEDILDCAHVLMDYGVDTYKKPSKKKVKNEIDRLKEIAKFKESDYREIWDVLPNLEKGEKKKPFSLSKKSKFPSEPESNILKFIEENAINLTGWQRELIRIVRNVAQYFYPQSQCLTGNTYVHTDKGMIRMDNLIKKEGYHEKEINVLSLYGKKEKTSHFYKKKTNKTIKIKTSLGKEEEATPEHPVMILDSDMKFKMKYMSNLKPGDFLVNPISYTNAFSKNEYIINYNFDNVREEVECLECNSKLQSLSTHLPIHNLNAKTYRNKFGNDVEIISKNILYKRSKDFKIPSTINPEISRYLGYLIAEGTFIKDSWGISMTDKECIQDIKNIFIKNFNIELEIKHHVNEDKKDAYSIGMHNKKFRDFLLSIGVLQNKSYTKEIPKCILQSTLECNVEFIRGLFEGDAMNSNGTIIYSTRSKELARQVQIILQNLGIISRIKEHDIKYDYKIDVPHKKHYSVKILSFYHDKFMKNIGFITERKNSNNKCKYHGIGAIAYPGVPYLNEYLEKIKLSIPKTTSKNSKIKRSKLPYSRSKMFRFDEIISQSDNFNYLKNNFKDNYDEIKECIKYNEYFYDEILEVKECNDEKFVYDFTIPSNHLFMSDGFISHNTKVANEGWASFCHYNIINKLHEENLVDDGFMMEFMSSHTNVIFQPDFDSKYYSGLNPYTLGFNIFMDIKRMSENPTIEDKEWFPDIAGGDWLENVHYAMENFRDDSLILQYLSPKVIRDMKLFNITDRHNDSRHYTVGAIHNSRGYEEVRKTLSEMNSRSFAVPDIKVTKAQKYKDRLLTLTHFTNKYRTLDTREAAEVLDYIHFLWGHPIRLYEIDEKGTRTLIDKIKSTIAHEEE
jgi:spore cortex formation protein SpoVR/YcgB (stage V sporulation)/intein/homing endonuclease